MTWEACGLVGLIVPGCLQFLFGSFVVYAVKVKLNAIQTSQNEEIKILFAGSQQ